MGRELGSAAERRLAAGILGVIAAAGPLIAYATVALPRPDGAEHLAPAVALAASLLIGLALLRFRAHVGWGLIALAVAAGSVVIAVVMLNTPGREATYAPYFIWLAVFSFYFLRPAVALAEVVLMALLYAVVISESEVVGGFEVWLHGVLTVLGVGLLAFLLRSHIRTLVGRLEAAARTDPLTGLPNRTAFLEQLDRESQRTIRFNSDYALALLDVDRLKQVNEGGGQGAGDEVLKQVAALMLQALRTTDWAAHVGGDDFAVILPGVAEPEAVNVAERLRELVERQSSAQGARPVTISVGVAGVYRGRLDARELLTAADLALQHAKRDGGNRVVGSIETSDYTVARP